MEFNQEENDKKMNEEEGTESKAKQWFQDNLRIVISVLIVVLIAGGIYSYSKRTQAPTVTDDSIITSEITPDNGETDGEASSQVTSDQTQTTPDKTTEEKTPTPVATTSQETGNSFVETAASGDSMTKLARKSLANYLEKNPDSALTAEHKIYIEDYLRKHVAPQRISVGTSVEFSKDLIKTAVESSKTLNSKQLQNLHKYVLRVPSLT